MLPKCCISVPKWSYLKVATFEPELQKCTSFTTRVPTFKPELLKVHFLCYTCTEKLRLSSRSCQSVSPLLHCYTGVDMLSRDFRAGAAKVRFLYYTCTVATFEPELPECISFTTLVLKIVTFQPELPKCVSFITLVLKSCDF